MGTPLWWWCTKEQHWKSQRMYSLAQQLSIIRCLRVVPVRLASLLHFITVFLSGELGKLFFIRSGFGFLVLNYTQLYQAGSLPGKSWTRLIFCLTGEERQVSNGAHIDAWFRIVVWRTISSLACARRQLSMVQQETPVGGDALHVVSINLCLKLFTFHLLRWPNTHLVFSRK